jgi:hypothetical protein
MNTYGKSGDGNLAICVNKNPASAPRTTGVWDACEVAGEFYRIVEYDELSEAEMDRMDDLEREAGK